MKVKVRGIPPLTRLVENIEVTIEKKELHVKELLKHLRSKVKELPFDEEGNVKAGYIALINGVDVRVLLLEEGVLRGDLEVIIIPVNHGG